MEEVELLRRADDLSRRCLKKWEMTNTGFLNPAEQMLLEQRFHPSPGVILHFFGGYEGSERSVAFFLPEDESISRPEELLHAVHYRACFGEPDHRDYLGALLASGISRDRLGDILIDGAEATVFCLSGICSHLLSLDRIGRISVKAEEIPLNSVRIPHREKKSVIFTVMSLRADAVAAGMFRISRSACARYIAEGFLNLNYRICTRCDASVKEGDILSLRGHGKGLVAEIGGNSRKGRLFIRAEIYQ
ncbi:MAG: hypothetical protein K6C12_03090 [Oscillospiraceae bacterium]|nr:hypothetical protein [Oscillospiraceae bacterium]